MTEVTPTIPPATWPPPPRAAVQPPQPQRKRLPIGRLIILGGAVVVLLGFGLAALGSSAASKATKQQNPNYPQLATDLCQNDLDAQASPGADDIVTFDPDPVVVRDGLSYAISGNATVASQRTTYSCDVVLQGETLVMSRMAFGG